MSSFTQPLQIEQLKDKGLWKVTKAFDYHVGSEDSKEVISIPYGYITDLASIPRILWSIVGHPLGRYAQSALLHDFCCEYRLYTRKRCDQIFLESMKVLEVPLIKRSLMYYAVRLFGFIPWNSKKPSK